MPRSYLITTEMIARLAAESLLVAVALGLRLIPGVVRIRGPKMCPAAELVDVRGYQLSKEVDLRVSRTMERKGTTARAQLTIAGVLSLFSRGDRREGVPQLRAPRRGMLLSLGRPDPGSRQRSRR